MENTNWVQINNNQTAVLKSWAGYGSHQSAACTHGQNKHADRIR